MFKYLEVLEGFKIVAHPVPLDLPARCSRQRGLAR